MAKNSDLKTIEELSKKNKTPNYIFEGVKIHMGWAAGKAVTEKEYLFAVDKFLSEPSGSKTAKSKRAALLKSKKEKAVEITADNGGK